MKYRIMCNLTMRQSVNEVNIVSEFGSTIVVAAVENLLGNNSGVQGEANPARKASMRASHGSPRFG
jgi:hypothetical protein